MQSPPSAASPPKTKLSNDTDEFLTLALTLFLEHYQMHVPHMHLESFDDDMESAVAELLAIQLDEPVDVTEAFQLFRLYKPCRTSTDARPQLVQNTIARLVAMPVMEQRTPEWYAFRHTLITASAIHKAHGSDAKRNELIVEKCNPDIKLQSHSMDDARHWGVKYEPVSVAYYSFLYATKIQEFGCLRHPSIEFLGASPDGIAITESSPRYGRMLEIKNPVSREITGIPKMEYWIQVQHQMAVCGLHACDFLETKFVEYASRAEFDADGTFTTAADGSMKGLILCVAKNETTSYAYPPFQCNETEYEAWETETLAGAEWVSTLHWKLADVLCTVIEYCDDWFQASVPLYHEIWRIIQDERVSGEWTKRLPKKRS